MGYWVWFLHDWWAGKGPLWKQLQSNDFMPSNAVIPVFFDLSRNWQLSPVARTFPTDTIIEIQAIPILFLQARDDTFYWGYEKLW